MMTERSYISPAKQSRVWLKPHELPLAGSHGFANFIFSYASERATSFPGIQTKDTMYA